MILSLLSFNLYSQTCGTQSPTNDKLTVITDEDMNARLWNENDRHDLTYCISNRFKELKPTIERAMSIASQDWMEYAGITFKYLPEEDERCNKKRSRAPKVRFKVKIVRSIRYPYGARAFFPYDERDQIDFKISTVEKDFNNLLRVTRHELGHVLGLRHEHIRFENPMRDKCDEKDDHFEGITDYDQESIMHYSKCGSTKNYELSTKDREGIAKLYPKF